MWPNNNGMWRQTSLPPATHYSIDVECVATGLDHNARGVAQIALVVITLPWLFSRLHFQMFVHPTQLLHLL